MNKKRKKKSKSLGGTYDAERSEFLSAMRASDLGITGVAKQNVRELLSEAATVVLPKAGFVSGLFDVALSTTVTQGTSTHHLQGAVVDFDDFDDDALVTYRIHLVHNTSYLLDNTTTTEA